MRILLLSNPISPHTIKWSNSLANAGFDILLFGLNNVDYSLYNPSIKIESVQISKSIQIKDDGNYLKSVYLTALPKLKKTLKIYRPDIFHAHYASSYGFLGALSGFNPFYLSVWGNDIFDFPQKSLLHKMILKYTLRKADYLFSTSEIMRKETHLYIDNEINIIPFGVDPVVFKPEKVSGLFKDNETVIGAIKTLEPNYGMEYLIETFILLKKKYLTIPLKLLIVGGGSLEAKLKLQSGEYLDKDIIFTGKISHDKVIDYHNEIDIAVYPSISESFGVSVIESMACEKPVVASKVGGIPEIVVDGLTGYLVSPRDSFTLAEKIEKLILDLSLRKKMGSAGRERVKKYFDLNKNVEQMIEYYNKSVRKVS